MDDMNYFRAKNENKCAKGASKLALATVTALAFVTFVNPAIAQSTDLPASALEKIAEADRIAGEDPLLKLMRTYHCYYVDPVEAPFRPSPRDRTDLLYGTKFLDNVWYLGYMNMAVYAIETSEGLVLIDGGADEEDGPRIAAWLEEAGFTPSDIEYIIITHEHGDHYLGVPHLKELNPDIKLVVGAAAEWEEDMAMFEPFDLEVEERTELTVGDTEFVFMPTPGHTPGTISVFVPVQIQGEEYMASFWGGKGMRPNVENTQIMLESVRAFSEESERLNVTVPLNTHGWGDGTVPRIINSILVPDLPNPFIMTPAQSEANNQILEQCTAAYLDAVESGAITD